MFSMILAGTQKLNDLIKKHPDCEKQLTVWAAKMRDDQYKSPHQLKRKHQKASIIGDKNVVFNICGNMYRIWVKIDYQAQVVLVIKAGTHKEYDNWDIQ